MLSNNYGGEWTYILAELLENSPKKTASTLTPLLLLHLPSPFPRSVLAKVGSADDASSLITSKQAAGLEN